MIWFLTSVFIILRKQTSQKYNAGWLEVHVSVMLLRPETSNRIIHVHIMILCVKINSRSEIFQANSLTNNRLCSVYAVQIWTYGIIEVAVMPCNIFYIIINTNSQQTCDTEELHQECECALNNANLHDCWQSTWWSHWNKNRRARRTTRGRKRDRNTKRVLSGVNYFHDWFKNTWGSLVSNKYAESVTLFLFM